MTAVNHHDKSFYFTFRGNYYKFKIDQYLKSLFELVFYKNDEIIGIPKLNSFYLAITKDSIGIDVFGRCKHDAELQKVLIEQAIFAIYHLTTYPNRLIFN